MARQHFGKTRQRFVKISCDLPIIFNGQALKLQIFLGSGPIFDGLPHRLAIKARILYFGMPIAAIRINAAIKLSTLAPGQQLRAMSDRICAFDHSHQLQSLDSAPQLATARLIR